MFFGHVRIVLNCYKISFHLAKTFIFDEKSFHNEKLRKRNFERAYNSLEYHFGANLNQLFRLVFGFLVQLLNTKERINA